MSDAPPPQRSRQQAGSSPPDVVGQQRQVQAEGEPLSRAEEHHAEEEMDEVLRENQLHGAEFKTKKKKTRQSHPRNVAKRQEVAEPRRELTKGFWRKWNAWAPRRRAWNTNEPL